MGGASAINNAGLETFGKRLSVREDWVEEYTCMRRKQVGLLTPLLVLKKHQTGSRKLQRESRRCEYWNKLCSETPEGNDRDGTRTMYDKINVARVDHK